MHEHDCDDQQHCFLAFAGSLASLRFLPLRSGNTLTILRVCFCYNLRAISIKISLIFSSYLAEHSM